MNGQKLARHFGKLICQVQRGEIAQKSPVVVSASADENGQEFNEFHEIKMILHLGFDLIGHLNANLF